MATSALRISGRKQGSRFDFINGEYVPTTLTHNDRPAWVARGVASRYIFHTGNNRWVVSKVMDDGYKCWAYVKAGASASPANLGPWSVCDSDGEWRADPNIGCEAFAAPHDPWFNIRVEVEKDLVDLGFHQTKKLKTLWRTMDFNGNGIVSLAEIDKAIVEGVQRGVYPQWLNNKPALMRAYKKTTLKDGNGDCWVQKHEFHDLLLNIYWFNKLWKEFEVGDSDSDRRMSFQEFQAYARRTIGQCNPQQMFQEIDHDGGGMILFVEFCAWVRHQVNPDAKKNFDKDLASGGYGGHATYSLGGDFRKSPMHHHHHHHHGHTREIDFSAVAPQASVSGGAVATRHLQDTLRSCHGDKATKDVYVKEKGLKDFDELEAKLKTKLRDHSVLKREWDTLDFNGNGVVSLAEIDKYVVENYPLLNHKPALMRCYKCSMERRDEFVHRREFKKMILNLFYFNKLFYVFDECDGDDRRIDLQEFKQMLHMLRAQVGDEQAEFSKIDRNGGGIILFDEFCHYICSKAAPPSMTDFADDGMDRSHYDGTGQVLAMASHQRHAHW